MLEDSDDEFEMPFKDANDLMSIFENLEEKNLFLIQQGQENEQQIEEKKREFALQKKKAETEFGNLENREREMQTRTDKTMQEFQTLKAETLDETSKTISP